MVTENVLYRPRDWVNGTENPFGKHIRSGEMARTIMRTVMPTIICYKYDLFDVRLIIVLSHVGADTFWPS